MTGPSTLTGSGVQCGDVKPATPAAMSATRLLVGWFIWRGWITLARCVHHKDRSCELVVCCAGSVKTQGDLASLASCRASG
jgi:hypothetical protein